MTLTPLADKLAQESENLEELTRLAYLVLQGLDITRPEPNKLLTKVASLCYQVCHVISLLFGHLLMFYCFINFR